MIRSTGHVLAALSRMQFVILLLVIGLLSSRCVDLYSADVSLLRANYAGISGAFAPVWIAAESGLFPKYGLTVDLRYIAPATATQGLLAKSLDIVNPGG